MRNGSGMVPKESKMKSHVNTLLRKMICTKIGKTDNAAFLRLRKNIQKPKGKNDDYGYKCASRFITN